MDEIPFVLVFLYRNRSPSCLKAHLVYKHTKKPKKLISNARLYSRFYGILQWTCNISQSIDHLIRSLKKYNAVELQALMHVTSSKLFFFAKRSQHICIKNRLPHLILPLRFPPPTLFSLFILLSGNSS